MSQKSPTAYEPNKPYIFTTRTDNNIIGMPQIDEATGRTILKDPRLLIISPGSIQGQINMNLFLLPGKPQSLVIVERPQFYYPVADEAILNFYTESTTGIKVPNRSIEVVKG